MVDEESSGPAGIIGSVDLEGGHATVVLRGEIDIAAAGQLRGCLTDCLDAGCSSVAVDMGSVEFLDSTGLRILVETALRLKAGYLTVVNPPRMVRRVIQITALEDRLRMEPPDSASNGTTSYEGNSRSKGSH